MHSIPDGAHLDALESVADWVLAEPGVVALERPGRGGNSYRRLGNYLKSKPPSSSSLTQVSMVRCLATSGAGVGVIVGKAGAGETTALAISREVFESAGFVVSGAALSARAVAILAAGYGVGHILGPLVVEPTLHGGYRTALLVGAALVLAAGVGSALLCI